ncbi:hypothetical protein J2847_000956 [Azospirillum agricola]|uniref:protein phosphatase 2C domain-containing protein n=1 Tax=Azospirillum agricola TaxID=1720247 RepID=UPI001AE3B5C5|nr:protein phosphatase 2C domain-containing protein [Azospirillum agricola]MBP2227674.1 hypothetical protein [Azospirillum agricola]
MAAVPAERADALWTAARQGTPVEVEVEVEASGGALLLPRCRNRDRVLPQPPLALRLYGHEVAELSGGVAGGPFAITCFGPEQDKSRNEDAALSAVIRGKDGDVYSFAAVADGVSTRTFWAERASRLACVAAYRATRTFLWEHGLSVAGVREHFPGHLARVVRAALHSDRDWLRSMPDVSPPDWAPDLYRRYEERDDFWYNSTLLVTCLGRECGLVYWVGDGAVLIDKTAPQTEPVRNHALRSDETLEISSFVSLSAPMDFVGGPINYTVNETRASGIRVLLGSDGLDRTLQSGERLGEIGQSIAGRPDPLGVMQALWQAPGAERDNYSLACASWPLDAGGPGKDGVQPPPAPDEALHRPAPRDDGGRPESGDAAASGQPAAPSPANAAERHQTADAAGNAGGRLNLGEDLKIHEIISDIEKTFFQISKMFDHELPNKGRSFEFKFRWVLMHRYFTDKIHIVCDENRDSDLIDRIMRSVYRKSTPSVVDHPSKSAEYEITQEGCYRKVMSYLRGEATGLPKPFVPLGKYSPDVLCRELEAALRGTSPRSATAGNADPVKASARDRY